MPTIAKPELRPAVPAEDAKSGPANTADAAVEPPKPVSDPAPASEPAKAEAAPPQQEAPKAAEASEPAKAAPEGPKAADTAAASEPTPEQSAAAAAAAENVPLPLTKPLALARVAPEITGPIAIFISLKEKKIYVRQHFWPLFEGPVTIKDPDRPLGTHVFTALEYLQDGSSFRWNVVTFPQEPKTAQAQYVGWNKKPEPPKPVTDLPQSSPQDALARIEIPKDVIEHISELMTPGSSLLISDQTASSETTWFRGTDFIVTMRQ